MCVSLCKGFWGTKNSGLLPNFNVGRPFSFFSFLPSTIYLYSFHPSAIINQPFYRAPQVFAFALHKRVLRKVTILTGNHMGDAATAIREAELEERWGNF